jgi:type II secretory pathway pseudopilin PulG
MNITSKKEELEKSKPPYLLGLLGLFPLVGFFVGIGLTLYGVIKYKDRKLTLIGIACILFTVLAYSALFLFGNYSELGKKAIEQNAQVQLNSLIKNIEYYKIKNGKYPDSLKQLENKNEIVFIVDPTQSELGSQYYNYKNLGEKYILFSSGNDQTKNTSDDLYPKIENSKNIGWIINESNSR